MTLENQGPMKVELQLPDELVEEFYCASKAPDIPPRAYLAELVCQHLAGKSLRADGLLDSQPDWQAALLQFGEDLAAGGIVDRHEVAARHNSRRE